MSARPLPTILWDLRKRVSPPPTRGVTDTELLQRFVNTRDESAFELLVWRHGPMVLSVCGRLLSDAHAQEDAFQATFLTLVRKAPSIGKRSSVGSWLYKVAHRIALRARARAALRSLRERSLGDAVLAAAAYTPTDDLAWRELRPVLDSEVRRLPDKYRAAFVLCYLEGKSNEEAAAELGCPEGTIYSRLARARDILRSRLQRRGLGIQAGPLAAVLTKNAPARQAVERNVTDRMVSMAALVAAGKTGHVSASVLQLMEGALKEMWLSKLIFTSVAVLAVVLSAAAASVSAYQTLIYEPKPVRSDGCYHLGDTGSNNDGGVPGTGSCGH
jgi:RNA polymerase sigma factor (sigma-70 family)